jgi:hypothetical protein
VHQFLGNGFPADLEDLEKFPATGKNSRSSWIVGLPVRELGVATASRPQSRISEVRPSGDDTEELIEASLLFVSMDVTLRPVRSSHAANSMAVLAKRDR